MSRKIPMQVNEKELSCNRIIRFNQNIANVPDTFTQYCILRNCQKRFICSNLKKVLTYNHTQSLSRRNRSGKQVNLSLIIHLHYIFHPKIQHYIHQILLLIEPLKIFFPSRISSPLPKSFLTK